LLREAAQYLTTKGIPNGRLDAEVLMAHVLGWQRIDLYLRHDQPMAGEELDRFREAIRRRSQREPLAYITGTKEFWSLLFRVTPRVLIPRPETEVLVEAAVQAIRERETRREGPLRVLEIGTGSGAAAIALATEVGEGIQLFATDRSPEALEIAMANARALNAEGRVRFLQGDLFEALGPNQTPFSVILSNPPYVDAEQMEGLEPEIRDYEPREALDGGDEGLAVIGRIIREAPRRLEAGGALLLEVGDGQRASIEEILRGSGCWSGWAWRQDLSGKDRVLCATKG
jgi:release factor glutamine methyltransferase